MWQKSLLEHLRLQSGTPKLRNAAPQEQVQPQANLPPASRDPLFPQLTAQRGPTWRDTVQSPMSHVELIPKGTWSCQGMDEQGKARTVTALHSAGAQDSTQIASLNFITLSQFHEFNIVPGLLFV